MSYRFGAFIFSPFLKKKVIWFSRYHMLSMLLLLRVFCVFFINIFFGTALCYKDFALTWLFFVDPYIHWDCSQVYSAAVLLCAVPLITTQCEAGRGKAVFKDFWRPHLNLLYLSVFLLTFVKEHFFFLFLYSLQSCTCSFQQQRYSTRFVMIYLL